MEAPGTWSCQLTAAPGHQSDSALACSSAPHPSDPQPPNLTTKREKTDIPTLLSADILALRLHKIFANPLLWNVDVRFAPFVVIRRLGVMFESRYGVGHAKGRLGQSGRRPAPTVSQIVRGNPVGGRRTILAMLLIAAVAMIWNLLGR